MACQLWLIVDFCFLKKTRAWIGIFFLPFQGVSHVEKSLACQNIELLGGSAISILTFKNSFDQDAQMMFFYSRFRCYVNLIAWRRPWITKDWKLNFWMKTAFPGKLESVILSGWWVHSIPFVGEKSLSDFCWSWPPSLALPSSLFRPRICRLNSSWENR